ncbi:hypothetical protein GCM10009839_69800 [Catenulispora yoronensis]|uniref:DUF4034 domain-containing protein n=1 Tax=Catenulispora yoronensis TaxID=450799 RepID=A0ABP5GU78_9ACTN
MKRPSTPSPTPPPAPSGRLVWDLAGPDRALALACEDLRAGRYASTRDLLATTVDTDVRCYRTLVLAGPAAGTGAVDRWLEAEPDNPHCAALRARTAVVRAARAQREKSRHTSELVARARDACELAAGIAPGDPVPLVALLHLATIAPTPVPAPPDVDVDVAGPWDLMARVWRLDTYNREAHQRLLAAVGPRGSGSVADMFHVARRLAAGAPHGSSLLVLPLLGYVESFRAHAGESWRQRVVLADRQWSTAHAHTEIENAYHRWFAAGSGDAPGGADRRLAPDLHHLAHALWAAGMNEPAAEVFGVLGPYASTVPWSLHGDPETVLLQARARCGLPAP